MKDCINLQEQFGDRYRVTFEDARAADHPQTVNPWDMQIPCRRGTIYPHGGSTLAVEIERHQLIAGQLRALPCCRLHQRGDHDATFLFDLDDFDKVAEIVLPHRRPQWTEARKAENSERLKRWQFRPVETPQQIDAPSHGKAAG